MSAVSGRPAAANWLALSASVTAPAAGDTNLPGEIASGTLTRKQASYAHTPGTSFYTLTYTFTFDQAISITKVGVFESGPAVGGTLVFESLLADPAPGVSGDQTAITATINI